MGKSINYNTGRSGALFVSRGFGEQLLDRGIGVLSSDRDSREPRR